MGVKLRSVPQEPSPAFVAIDVAAHDLATIVDADDLVDSAVRRVKDGEVAAPVPDVAVAREVVDAGELAAIVDVEDQCADCGVGSIDRGEDTVLQDERAGIQ